MLFNEVANEGALRVPQDESRADAIVVDAFSGDSIPIHLITTQAADLYRSRLADNGLLLFHISNRTLDLKPIVLGLAQHLGWGSALFVSYNYETTGETASTWAPLTANREFLRRIDTKTTQWPSTTPIQWSDDYASMWHVLKF